MKKKRLLQIILLVLAFALLNILPAAAETKATPYVSANGGKKTLYYGETLKLTAHNFKGKVTWSSSKPKLATISSAGQVRVVANASGKVTFKAKYQNAWATYNLQIRKVYLNYTRKNLNVGDKFTLTISMGSGQVNWHIANSSILAFYDRSKAASKVFIAKKGKKWYGKKKAPKE